MKINSLIDMRTNGELWGEKKKAIREKKGDEAEKRCA